MAAKSLRQAFGKTLRESRLEKNLSQEQLAFEAGLTRNYISIIELGRQSATLDIVEALAKALEIPASILISRAERSIR